MLLNITYNFGNHRTVTKRLDFLGHAEYILGLSADELKVAELLFYHEPDKDELFAIQNLRGHVRSLQNRNAEAEGDYVTPLRQTQSTPRDSSEPIFLFLDEVEYMPESVRAAIREIGESLRIREDKTKTHPQFQMPSWFKELRENPEVLFFDEVVGCDCCIEFDDSEEENDEDSGGGECMCDWEYRTRCTCGFEDKEEECGGCGENAELCLCEEIFFRPKPNEPNTNFLANADYFRKLARERVLSDLNNTFSDMIEKGDDQICDIFYPWVINVLREKGYDVQVLEEWQCEDELWEEASLENKVPAWVFLPGRD